MIEKKELGQKISFWRQWKRITRNKLASDAKVNPSFVGRVESGLQTNTDIYSLKRVVEALGGEVDIKITWPEV